MANEIGSDYSGGDYLQSNYYNDAIPLHNVAKVDAPDANKSRVRAAHLNDLGAEVVAIATRLGTAVRGTRDTLAERLDQAMDTTGNVGKLRFRRGYSDTAKTALYNNTAAPVAGDVFLDEGTETVANAADALVTSKTRISGSRNHKRDLSRTSLADSGRFRTRWSVADGAGMDGPWYDVEVDGFEIDGNAAVNAFNTESGFLVGFYNVVRGWIRNMYLHDASGDGVYVHASKNVLIQGNQMDIPYKGTYLLGGGRSPVVLERSTEGIIIDANFLKGNIRGGVHIEPSAGSDSVDVIISGNVIDCDAAGTPDSVTANIMITTSENVRRIIITNNIIKNGTKYGIFVQQGGVNVTCEVIITNNVIYDNAGDGILVAGAQRITIANNYIYSNGGIGININAGADHTIVKGNQICNNVAHGIGVYGANSDHIKNITIEGNHCYDNDTGNTNTYSGIYITYADKVAVLGNQCYDSHASGKTQLNGLYVNYVDGALIDGNVMKDNKTYDAWMGVNNTLIQWGINYIQAAVRDNWTSSFRTPPDEDFFITINDNTGAHGFMALSSPGTILFGAMTDGKIRMGGAIANTKTPSGATAYAFPLYNESGALLGYIPIYAAQWTA